MTKVDILSPFNLEQNIENNNFENILIFCELYLKMLIS